MAIDIIGYINTQEPVVSWTSEKKQAMLDDYVTYYDYQETIDGEPNPQSKKAFANEKIQREIKQKVNAVRKRVAEENASYDEIAFE